MADKQKYTPIFHECAVPGKLQRQKSSGRTDEFLADNLERPAGEIPGPRVRLLNHQVITSAGQPTTLECQVLEWNSEGEQYVQWFHGGVVCNGERYLSLSDTGGHYLFIKDTVTEDGGEYIIIASCGRAKTERVVFVRVTQPQHPEICTTRRNLPAILNHEEERATILAELWWKGKWTAVTGTGDVNHPSHGLQDFPDYVAKIRGSEAIGMEFLEVELEWDVTQHAANLACNKYKNRYCNIFPYDHSRVLLSLREDCPGSDYINASHMMDSVSGCRYIATQGPLRHTYADFWRMVLEFDIHVIAMVTKTSDSYGIREENYWPTDGTSVFDGIKVTLNHVDKKRHWVTRSFTILKTSTGGAHEADREMPRIIIQFQFVSWPEYGVPKRATDLLNFRQCVADHHGGTTGPLLVHCSAGVGRTGTFISIDVLLKRMEKEGAVDVFNLVRELRFRRERTVETLEQYLLIHEAIAEVITSGHKK